jgi:ribosomal protein S18 acetylase RimI-like enzyme
MDCLESKKESKRMRTQMRLKDGSIVKIEPLNGREDAKEFQEFINTLTKEKTYLLVDKPVTLKEEKQWLKTQLLEHRKGHQIYLKALINGRLIGDCFAKPGFGRNQGNVNLGIAIAKNWRRKGLGYLLLTELIERSEQKWHPKNIYLHVISKNTTARRLYETLGFHIIATLPDWFEYEKKYLDEYMLILDKEKFVQQKKTSYEGSKKR